MLFIWSGNLKPGREKAFEEWVKKSTKQWNEHSPPRWKLLGFYSRKLTIGRYDFSMIWEFEEFADFDATQIHEDPVYGRLEDELEDFLLPGCGETWVLKRISES